MGLLAAFVGFSSAFIVVLEGLKAAGASDAQAASGLMAVTVAMGLGAIIFSIWDRIPVWIAWSTPGAALLVSTGAPPGGFAEAVGAFVVAAALTILAGLIRPLTKAISAIPVPLANALVAGILFGLCLAPFEAIAFDAALGLPILVTWVVFMRFAPKLAVPAALIAFLAVMVLGVDLPENTGAVLSAAVLPAPEFVWPVFTLASAINIGLPLFIVTMASQNIPGVAILKAQNFPLKPGKWFTGTGVLSALGAMIGGHAVNLAALTAAMCASDQAHPDPARRYWAGIIAGAASVLIGLFAGFFAAFVSLAPAVLIAAVAGLALIPTFINAAIAAFEAPHARIPAAITFLLTASGVTILGISGAFWGLIAGLAALALAKR